MLVINRERRQAGLVLLSEITPAVIDELIT